MKIFPRLFLTLYCLGLFTPIAQASDFLSKVSFSGFGTLGGIGTDTDVIGYYRNTAQKKAVDKSWGATTDSRLGLQLDIAFNQQFHFTTQWVARDHVGHFFEQNLELAFIRWSPRSDIDIRIGRLNVDLFLLSDHQDIGYAYPWMRPPHEFYAYLPGSHFDGVDFSQHFRIGDSFLKLKIYAGNSHSALREATKTLNLPLVGGNISYNTGNWRAKINYTYLHILNEGVENILDILNNPALNQIFPSLDQLSPQVATEDKNGHYLS
ncbi:MAG: hypothetical protein GQ582_00600 [Methyloprofundus sp.]|nr:hypothetical protein [Methyloprofundus sp.]